MKPKTKATANSGRGKSKSNQAKSTRKPATPKPTKKKIVRKKGLSVPLQGDLGLQESEQNFRETLENIQLIVVLLDLKGRVSYVNNFLLQVTGYTRDEMLGCDWFAQFVPGVRADVKKTFLQGLKSGEIAAQYENPIRTKSGEERFIRFSNTILRDELGKIIGTASFGEDVTANKQNEERILRMNRALQMVSACKQTLVRAQAEKPLLDEVCQAIVNVGGYRLAWVGFAKQDRGRSVRPVAQVGFEQGYLETLKISWGDTRRGRGPTGSSIRSGQSVIARNIHTDANFAPWRSEALKRGYASSIALPLKSEGQTLGALNVYSPAPQAFDAEEVKLLEELADDLAYGVSSLRARAAHRQAEEALHSAERNYRLIFDHAPVGIFQSTLDGRFLKVNSAMVKIYGYSSPEEMSESVQDVTRQIYAEPSTWKEFQRLLAENGEVMNFENKNIRKDGSMIWALTNARAVRDAAGRTVYYEGFIRDITERKRADLELRLSEQRFSNAFKASPAGITITRVADGKFIDVNESFLRMFELNREEAIGHTSTELNMWTQEERKKLMQKQLESGGLRNFELQARSKSGRVVNILFSSKPMELEGETHHITTMIDITERKRATEVLRESEERYRLVLENSMDAILLTAPDGSILSANPAACEIFQRTEEEICRIGRNELVDINDPRLPVLLEERARTGKAKGELTMLRKDGARFQVELSTSVFIDRNGEKRTSMIIRDITERKQDERAVQESEERLRLSTELANVAVWEFSFITNSMTRSKNHDWLYGLAWQDKWEFETFLNAIHPDDREYSNQIIQKSAAPGGPNQYQIDFRVVYPDQSIHWLSVVGQVVERNSEGQGTLVRGCLIDITARKQAEKETHHYFSQLTALNKVALQLQRLHSPQILSGEIIKLLELILNFSYGAVLLIDESGEWLMPFALSAQKQGSSFAEQDKKYVESKDIRVGKGITGWVAQSGQTIRLGDVQHDARYFGMREDIRSELCAPLKVVERVIGVINVESTQADAYSESDERILETIAAQISIAIHNSQLFEQVQAQTAQLEQRVKERTLELSAANKELESFSYSVSHDLRAPLRAVSGFAEIITRRHRASLNEEGQHYFDNIIQASERMGRLIDDLRTYSRLGRAGVRLEPISLAGVLANITNGLKGNIDELHGTIRVAEDLPDVTGDRTLLSQIFSNLLENAVKYRKENAPPQIIIDWQTDGEDVILRVSDNGIGIPTEYQEKIFDMFQRLHSEEEYSGTGVGLATVKKSIELLGGNVWVESKVGEGSTFSVRLPKSER